MTRYLKSQIVSKEVGRSQTSPLLIMRKFNLYQKDGWLNVPDIARLNCWLNVIIGPRQVGKTYGTLKYLLDVGNQFFYMRRTGDELGLVCDDPRLNPFRTIEGYSVEIVRAGGSYDIREMDGEETKRSCGIAMSLSRVAKIRGFNGSDFTDLVFDEFIPERIVIKRKNEGEAFLNAYTTINGNRELKGRAPLRAWLLANANDFESPILSALELTGAVEKMARTGQEYMIKDGIFIALPKSERVIEKRKETAMMRHLRKNKGGFYQMAAENKFAYNSLDLVKPKSLKGYSPLLRIGDIYIYDNGTSAYACWSPHRGRLKYAATREGIIQAQLECPELKSLYDLGYLTFCDATCLMRYKDLMGIKD